jgi:hypothetical protein
MIRATQLQSWRALRSQDKAESQAEESRPPAAAWTGPRDQVRASEICLQCGSDRIHPETAKWGRLAPYLISGGALIGGLCPMQSWPQNIMSRMYRPEGINPRCLRCSYRRGIEPQQFPC